MKYLYDMHKNSDDNVSLNKSQDDGYKNYIFYVMRIQK
jgi:hypothetical protein